MNILKHVGTVIDGNHKGVNVCYVNDGTFEAFALYSGALREKKWYEANEPYTIITAFEKNSVDHYVELSAINANETSVAQNQMIKNGVNWGILGAALTAGIAHTMGQFDFAIYLKNGDKFIIRLVYKDMAANLKRMFFKL